MKNNKILLIIITNVLVIAILGFLFYLYLNSHFIYFPKNPSINIPQGNNQSPTDQNSSPLINPNSHTLPTPPPQPPLVQGQRATSIGTITKKDNDSITVQSADGKYSQTFNFASVVVIYPLASPGSRGVSGTTNKDAIILNKPVVINLILENGKYLVNTITYLANF